MGDSVWEVKNVTVQSNAEWSITIQPTLDEGWEPFQIDHHQSEHAVFSVFWFKRQTTRVVEK